MQNKTKNWRNLTIEDIASFQGGSQPPKSTFESSPSPYNIRLLQIRDYRSDKNITYIPKELAKRWCTKNDIMIGRYGPPIFQILRGKEGSYNVALIKAIPKDIIDREYLYYFLKAEPLFRLIDRLSQRSSGQTGIDMEALKQFPVKLPPLPEQRKIAEILGTWDRAIETQQQLIDSLTRRKKALMQQLLTGKTRLPGFEASKLVDTRWGTRPEVWKHTKIENIAKSSSLKNKLNESIPVLSCTKHHGLVDSLTYFKKQVFSDDLSGYRVVNRGEFTYATNHIEEGSIGYQNIHDSGLVSPMYTVFKTDTSVISEFLFPLLKTELYIHIYQAMTNASVDRRGSLRWNDFSKIPLSIPSIEEQQAIATVLTSADKEIKLHTAHLESLRTQKRGLMQQLLSGKTRVTTTKN